MTDTTAISSTTSTTSAATPTDFQRKTGGTLGKDDFLKLMVAQLQHQDPMNPMQDSDMMGQMASFSTLEQITNMAAANQTIASNLTSTGAIGLIGRTVTYTDADDLSHTGVVSKVTTAGGSPSLTVDGVDGIDPATISQVA
jgi:flagellar basal-body rod modification protein FlgD